MGRHDQFPPRRAAWIASSTRRPSPDRPTRRTGDTGFAEWVKETKGAGSVDDRYTVDEAIKWLDTVAGQPFFLHMNLQSSHLPYVVPDDFPRRFSPKTIDFAIMWGKFPIDKVDIVKGRYADSLYYEDTQIARLFEYLKSRGLVGQHACS